MTPKATARLPPPLRRRGGRVPWRRTFTRTLDLPDGVGRRSPTTLPETPIEIGAKAVRRGRYITFRMAAAAIPGTPFVEVPHLIDGPRPAPLPP